MSRLYVAAMAAGANMATVVSICGSLNDSFSIGAREYDLHLCYSKLYKRLLVEVI